MRGRTSYEREVAVAEQAALAAGALIMRHYATPSIAVDTKRDTTPVTAADRDANEAILAIVREAFPADAILSEESPDDSSRLAKQRVWIIDPLDGTRDFIARTGEFAVHVGLAVEGVPTVGAVYQPAAQIMDSAWGGGGAFRQTEGRRVHLRVSSRKDRRELRIGISRLNPSPLVTRMLAEAGISHNAVGVGASVKHMALAAGELDAIVSLGNESDWDTCAPEVIVREAGGQLTDGDGRALSYNTLDPKHRRGSLVSNGACHAELVELVRPYLESR